MNDNVKSFVINPIELKSTKNSSSLMNHESHKCSSFISENCENTAQ